METQITIKYNAAVMVPAGWRSVEITASAKKISAKRAEVLEVLAIDGEEPNGYKSRTGANRQKYNAAGIAQLEVGKIKILSKCLEAQQ
jgi:hypothetical protein